MVQEPIKAGDYVAQRQRMKQSPAACRWPQFLRLVLLMAIGFGLVSVTLNPKAVISATSSLDQGLKPA
jgi:hypothetical protein